MFMYFFPVSLSSLVPAGMLDLRFLPHLKYYCLRLSLLYNENFHVLTDTLSHFTDYTPTTSTSRGTSPERLARKSSTTHAWSLWAECGSALETTAFAIVPTPGKSTEMQWIRSTRERIWWGILRYRGYVPRYTRQSLQESRTSKVKAAECLLTMQSMHNYLP